MSINNFFNVKQFLQLLQHDFRINKKTYLWTLAGIILILFGINYVFLLSCKWKSNEFIKANYFFPFLLSTTIMVYFIGTAFSELRDRIKTQNFLLLPASAFEKFLVQFVIRFMVFMPLMCVMFWTTAHLAKVALPSGNSAWQVQSGNYDHLPLDNEIDIKSVYYSGATQAEINYQTSQVPDFHFDLLLGGREKIEPVLLLIWCFIFVGLFVFFAGTVYFKRFTVVKSLVVLLVLFAVCVFATIFYNEYLISKIGLQAWQAGDNYFVNTVLRRYGGEFHPALFFLWMTLTIGLLLGFSYFNLKEKEI